LRWLDVCGAPGAGKSVTCYAIWSDDQGKEFAARGLRPLPYWKPYLEEVNSLYELVKDHISRDPCDKHCGQPSIRKVVGMNNRSIAKIAAVERERVNEYLPEEYFRRDGETKVFIQTGLVQRILGFGWRLHEMRRDINLIRTALWRMPVSVGVAFLEADLETLLARNRAREKDPRTAHENRSHQVPHMLACIPLVKEVLRARGVPVVEIDVQHQSVESARAQLLNFPTADICEPEALGPSR
jgi:hypothetical protein